MRSGLWAVSIAALAGCSGSSPDALPATPLDPGVADAKGGPAPAPPPIQAVVRQSRAVQVTPAAPEAIGDAGLEIAMRTVHASYSSPAGAPESGLPYVKVGDAWLEIAGTTTVVSGGRAYRLKLSGCSTATRSGGDYSYQAITGCTVLVDELDLTTAPVSTAGHVERITIAERDAAIGAASTGERGFVAVRSTGFSIGNTSAGFVVESIMSGVDVVTSFGVKNIDFGYETKPILGHEETFELGPQKVTLKVLDVGNVNTKCDPSCRNVYDFEVRTEPLPGGSASAPPVILEYR